MYNENKLDEVCKIMEELHKYVPSTPTVTTVALCGETLEHRDTNQHKILLGGDQLTAARARGAQALRCNHGTCEDRLVGLIPTVEDWHTRVILLQVYIV